MVDYIRNKKSSVGVFQCTSQYPTPLDKVGVNVIQEIKRRYDCLTGLSDHSGSVRPSIVAMSRGVDMIEVYVAMHNKAFGPDTSSSIMQDQLKLITQARDTIVGMNANPVDKNQTGGNIKTVRKLFTKSLALAKDMKKGDGYTPVVITMKKPGTGIPEAEKSNLYGKILARDVSKNTRIEWKDVIPL